MTASAEADSLTFDPPPEQWGALIRRSPSDAALAFRRDLGLPDDRPIVMTGHQAEFWHPGILAKYAAAQAVSNATGAAPVWLVVDQDANAFADLRIPIIADAGRLQVRSYELTDAVILDAPVGLQGAFDPIEPELGGARNALPSIKKGMERIIRALRKHRRARDAAAQISGAALDLLDGIIPRGRVLSVLDMTAADGFAALVDRCRHDPRAAAESYNHAVACVEGHGMAPLLVRGERIELPLWRLSGAAPRRRAYAQDLTEHANDRFAPRAILMTALVRMLGCDLFIHGTGGAAYDRVTEQWLADWLKLDPATDLAPAVMVTATRRLPFGRTVVTPNELAETIRLVRRMRHDPAALGEADAAAQKQRLVSAIAAADRHSSERAVLFSQMHDLLAEVRARHRDELAAADADMRNLARRAAEAPILTDRTWPFPFYDEADLLALRDDIFAALAT
ncbi:MAG: hypothetical protein KAS72_06465 [Phycisphaerales bacterium]|nr:hypothetical protein [Phycisphaerales bacterium]